MPPGWPSNCAMAPETVEAVDAHDIEHLDSAGVLLLLRYARRRGLDLDSFHFREDHVPLVSAIEDVADDRPKRKREYGVSAALARLGYAVHDNWREILALVGLPRREPDEVRPHARAATALPPDRDRLPHGAGGPGRRAARVPAVVSRRRGDRFPRREHPARLRRGDLRRRTGQRGVPARVRRAAHRHHPRRPHRERIHRADRRDAEPRGSRCDPHARHGSDRPARAAARDRVAGDAAAAHVHRDDRGPARRLVGGRLQPRHPAAGLPGAHGIDDRSAAFPRGPVEGAVVRRS